MCVWHIVGTFLSAAEGNDEAGVRRPAIARCRTSLNVLWGRAMGFARRCWLDAGEPP